MNCYACANEATSQCKRCGRLYCDEHGDALCAECLKPASALPSYSLYRGSLLALLVGSAFAIWLLLRPPGGAEESSPVALGPGDSQGGAEATEPAQGSPTPRLLRTPTPIGRATTPGPTGTPGTATPAAGREYTVQEGDTLYGIAESFLPEGKDLTEFVLEIATFNNLGDLSQVILQPGQVLRIP